MRKGSSLLGNSQKSVVKSCYQARLKGEFFRWCDINAIYRADREISIGSKNISIKWSAERPAILHSEVFWIHWYEWDRRCGLPGLRVHEPRQLGGIPHKPAHSIPMRIWAPQVSLWHHSHPKNNALARVLSQFTTPEFYLPIERRKIGFEGQAWRFFEVHSCQVYRRRDLETNLGYRCSWSSNGRQAGLRIRHVELGLSSVLSGDKNCTFCIRRRRIWGDLWLERAD